MKFIKILSLALLASILCIACDKAETSCPNTKTEFVVGNGKIYVPNIITPNGDGYNDNLEFFRDTGILSIKNIIVKNGKGKTIFEDEAGQNPITSRILWESDSYRGRFSYSFEAESIDGTIATISGHVLGFSGSGELDCDGCRFGTQAFFGEFDDSRPDLEGEIKCK